MITLLVACAFAPIALEPAASLFDWPAWRGPSRNGAAVNADPPTTWSESEGVAWKAPLPGHGKSTPIVYGERIFVLAAVATDKADEKLLEKRSPFPRQMTAAPDYMVAFLALAFDRRTGRPLWETTVTERLPVGGVHGTNGYASFSPVTDGKTLYVSFGSYGVYALDAASGTVRWSYELGPQHMRRGWGEAGSPALADDTLIVVADQEDDSRIHALDKRTGEVRWVKARDEPSTWTTPLVVNTSEHLQVVVNGTNAVRSYDVRNGDILWHCAGQTLNAIPSPVSDGERLVCTSGYQGQACLALDLAGRGDLERQEGGIAWRHDQGTPYVPSPLLADGRLYMLSGNSGLMSCLDVATGAVLVDRQRLPLGNVYASPIAAGGRIYVVDREGTTVVLQHDDDALRVLATNVIEDPIDATPAAVGATLYLRSDAYLYAIGKP